MYTLGNLTTLAAFTATYLFLLVYSNFIFRMRKSTACGKFQLNYHNLEKLIIQRYAQISPKLGHAFYKAHCTEVQLQGYPTELRPFLKQCGFAKEQIEEG